MVLKEYGARLLTLEEYVSTLLPIECPNDNETINHIGAVTTGDHDEYYLVQTSENGYRMMPGPEFSPRLYRGQTKHYPTCKAQIYRGINKENFDKKYADAIFWTAKRFELAFILHYHPAVMDVMSWDFDGLTFDIDIQAIAQHYQYPTQMLDLTRSKDIAMYFATHKFVGENLKPEPALSQTAVLYTIDVKKILDSDGKKSRLVPVGIDPMPRSAAQKAFAIELGIYDDLEKLEGVNIETFIVTEELVSELQERIGRNKSIFPFDPFEEIIRSVRNSSYIDEESISLALEKGLIPGEYSFKDIVKILRKNNYKVGSYKYIVPDNDAISAANNEWLKRREEYLNKIRYRGAADPIQTKT